MFKNLKYNQSEKPAENVLGSSYEDMLDKEALLGSKSELKMQDPNEMVSLSHEIDFIGKHWSVWWVTLLIPFCSGCYFHRRYLD